ncbi:MAG: hypothetical protein Q4C49_05080 [Bacillota bacterium]|nr:hypothetical protein [Bacillota bacterium]
MVRRFIERCKARIQMNRKLFIVYSILRFFVILTAVRCLFTRNYESFLFCILSLLLFLVPTFFEEKLMIEIPTTLHIIIYLFIYAAEILGEVNKYYTAIPGWDTMLHTINGFLCASIGFSLVQILNRGSKNLSLSPVYVALMAFCFSMTVGVLWEFFEYSCDVFLYNDTQKDFIVQEISSVSLDPTHSQIPIHVKDITKTTIETKNGDVYVIDGGYLDIGIHDTMKDLIVNFIGAVVFSVFGYIYEKNAKSFASRLMIRTLSEEEIETQNKKNSRKTVFT